MGGKKCVLAWDGGSCMGGLSEMGVLWGFFAVEGVLNIWRMLILFGKWRG